MNQIPIDQIKAPAFMFIDDEAIFFKDSIKVQKITTKSDVATSNSTKAGEIVTAQKIEIKGTPVAFSNSDTLFDVLSLIKGQTLPKISDCYIIARIASGEWVKWAFADTVVHDSVGSITFGSDTPMGEHGWSVYPDPTDTTAALVTCTTLSAAPTLPTMVTTDKFRLRCLAVYGTGTSKIECDTEGASIDISLSTEDAINDRLSIYGKRVTDIGVSGKFKPSNITYANWQTLTGINTVKEVGTFSSQSALPDLVLRGDQKGDFAFTLKAVSLADPSATFSASEALMDELTFNALGDSFGDNKLAISTTTDAFSFDTETETVNSEQGTVNSEQGTVNSEQ